MLDTLYVQAHYAAGFLEAMGEGSRLRGLYRLGRFWLAAQLRWVVSYRPDRPTLRVLIAETLTAAKGGTTR